VISSIEGFLITIVSCFILVLFYKNVAKIALDFFSNFSRQTCKP